MVEMVENKDFKEDAGDPNILIFEFAKFFFTRLVGIFNKCNDDLWITT